MKTVRCSACGDAMIFRHLPGEYEGFKEVQNFIARGDFRYVNLETTIHNFETYGAARSGGSWFCAEPSVLNDVKTFGFNMLSTANNHATDYAYIGLSKTLQYIRAAGLQSCGTGESLSDAAAPIYLDTLQGRIALIGCCSTFNPEAMAGEQTRTMPGRPGINGIRFRTVYDMPKEQIDQLQAVAKAMQLNAQNETERAQGYLPALPEGETEFGDMRFMESDHFEKRTILNKTDMARIEKMIHEAQFMADYIVISMHSHEMKCADGKIPDDFYVEFAHKCIDAGANAVVGSGAHFLRPIEIYQGCPIFYSLGDFIIQLETIRKAPVGFFEKQNMTGNEGLDEMFNARSNNGKKGLYYDPIMFRTVIPYWEAENGKLTKLELMPVELNFGETRGMGGWPRFYPGHCIIEDLAKMSAPYGTKITVNEQGIGVVELGDVK